MVYSQEFLSVRVVNNLQIHQNSLIFAKGQFLVALFRPPLSDSYVWCYVMIIVSAVESVVSIASIQDLRHIIHDNYDVVNSETKNM